MADSHLEHVLSETCVSSRLKVGDEVVLLGRVVEFYERQGLVRIRLPGDEIGRYDLALPLRFVEQRQDGGTGAEQP